MAKFNKKRLAEFVDRIERRQVEMAALKEDIAAVKLEAKAAGLKVKPMMACVKMRKFDTAERDEQWDDLLTPIPHMTPGFGNTEERFCYKNRHVAVELDGLEWLTRWVKAEPGYCGSSENTGHGSQKEPARLPLGSSLEVIWAMSVERSGLWMRTS